MHLKYRKANRFKDGKRYTHAHTNKMKVRVAILIWDKVNFRPKNISRIKMAISQ